MITGIKHDHIPVIMRAPYTRIRRLAAQRLVSILTASFHIVLIFYVLPFSAWFLSSLRLFSPYLAFSSCIVSLYTYSFLVKPTL
jgi:hypothetical protein